MTMMMTVHCSDGGVGKGRVQKPQARKLSVGGVPPPRPRGLHGRDFSKKLAENFRYWGF